MQDNPSIAALQQGNAPLVSVVVPTKNSDHYLSACLSSIRDQSYRSIEVIVVDNFSSDSTQEIARKFEAKLVVAGPERSRQRNLGGRIAAGCYVLFVDSDMTLEQDVVQEAVAICQAGAGGVVIPEVSEGPGFWAHCRALEKECYLGDSQIEHARFLRRDLFLRFRGYDERMHGGGEDWDLPRRMIDEGIEMGRTGAQIINDESELTLASSVRKKFYYGKTLVHYIKLHPELSRTQFQLIRPAFLRNAKRLARDPLHAFGMFVLKSFEFAAGFFGVAATHFSRTKGDRRDTQQNNL